MAGLKAALGRMRDRFGALPANPDADGFFKDLEGALLRSDVGTETAKWIAAQVKERAGENADLAALGSATMESVGELLGRLADRPVPWKTVPHVVMLVGTNGGGKTTTVAKLARKAQEDGKTVVLAAADTFRAAATAQLDALARTLGNVRVVRDAEDPGAVAYGAVSAGIASKADLVVIDTAGRQPTSDALMAEAKKIDRAVSKAMDGAPHERILAIDANTGQNALRQVEAFDGGLGLTGCVLTKLDGTARGGIIMAIALKHPVPVMYVGVGEGTDDLIPFRPGEFAEALFAAEAQPAGG